MYQSKLKLHHPPHGQSPGHLNFWKICVQIPPPRGEKLFKCSIIGPFQVIKYLVSIPWKKLPDYCFDCSITSIMPLNQNVVYVNVV